MADIDIGRLGENYFQNLCLSADLIPNSSEIDKTGWDFVVEFPFEFDSNKELDQQKGMIESKFQVKSTKTLTKKVQVKLSNLQRFVKTPLPTFFVFFEFDNEISPQRAYLMHVDKKLIERVLKRLRKLGISDASKLIHKKTMSIDYSQALEISPFTGETLKILIKSFIHNGIDKYVKKKLELLETVGYEGGYGHSSFTILGKDYGKLIDVSLGIEKDINILDFSLTESRFGIDSQKPKFEFPIGKVSMPVKPIRKGKLLFKKHKYHSGFSFPISVYSTALNEFVKNDDKKVRLKAEFFDFILSSNFTKANISLSLKGYMKLKLYKLEKLNKFIKFLSSSKENIILEQQYKGFPNSTALCSFDSLPNFIKPEASKIIDNTIVVSRYFKLSNPKVTIDDLMCNKDSINLLFHIINDNGESFSAKFTPTSDLFDIQKQVAFVLPFYSRVGKYGVGLIVVFSGYAQDLSDNIYSLKAPNIKQEHKFVVDLDTINKEEFEINIIKEVESILTKYGNNDFNLIRIEGS